MKRAVLSVFYTRLYHFPPPKVERKVMPLCI